MTAYDFWLKVIDNLPQIVAAITALVVLWRQSVNVKDTKTTIAVAASDTQTAIQNVHQQINGRMDQLIATTKSDSHAQGMSDQRDADNIVIK